MDFVDRYLKLYSDIQINAVYSNAQTRVVFIIFIPYKFNHHFQPVVPSSSADNWK